MVLTHLLTIMIDYNFSEDNTISLKEADLETFQCSRYRFDLLSPNTLVFDQYEFGGGLPLWF